MSEPTSLEQLPKLLGYDEPAELSELREVTVEAFQRGGDGAGLLARYQRSAEAGVDRKEGRARVGAQIGLSVQVALICRDGGLADEYYEDLKDAYTYALNTEMGMAEEVLAGALLDHAVAGLESLGMDHDDLVMAVYAEANELGIDDPESYLRAKGWLS